MSAEIRHLLSLAQTAFKICSGRSDVTNIKSAAEPSQLRQMATHPEPASAKKFYLEELNLSTL